MVQSPTWEANWFAASQEIPPISRNPKVHYRTHKRPPPVSILDQPNPVHIPTSHLQEIHPNIIHPSMPRSPQWFLPSGFPTKTLYTPSHHPYVLHAQPISFFSILSPAQYWVGSTDHLAPRYAISTNLLKCSPSLRGITMSQFGLLVHLYHNRWIIIGSCNFFMHSFILVFWKSPDCY